MRGAEQEVNIRHDEDDRKREVIQIKSPAEFQPMKEETDHPEQHRESDGVDSQVEAGEFDRQRDMVRIEPVTLDKDETKWKRGKDHKDHNEQLGQASSGLIVHEFEAGEIKPAFAYLIRYNCPGKPAMRQNSALRVQAGVEHLKHREKEVDEVQNKEHLQRAHIHHSAAIHIFPRKKSRVQDRQPERLDEPVINYRRRDEHVADDCLECSVLGFDNLFSAEVAVKPGEGVPAAFTGVG